MSRILMVSFLCMSLFAQDQSQDHSEESFLQSLNWIQGEIILGKDLATLTVGDDFRYLSPKDTERVLVAWGNPPGRQNLGMLFPSDRGPFDENTFGIIVSYEEDGYVADDDAADLDYQELLEDMQKASKENNKARAEQGYEPIEIVGWAEQPHYDASAHKLYWAKELKFGDMPFTTLNYDIRILGRHGVLVLSAVADMTQLDDIKGPMESALAMAEFNPGMRYSDFDPDNDKMADYGIGGLIAGKVAGKAGLFKGLLAILIGAKKLVILGLIALGVFLKKIISGRSSQEEESVA